VISASVNGTLLTYLQDPAGCSQTVYGQVGVPAGWALACWALTGVAVTAVSKISAGAGPGPAATP
jgi:hypothetical protein